jgi:phosphoglycolate phosphatase
MPEPMTIRAILFDKDGTLLDFEATWTPLYRRMALDLADGDAVKGERMLANGGFDPVLGRVKAGSVLGAGTTDQIVSLWFPELVGRPFGAMAERIDALFHAHGAKYSVPVADAEATLDSLAAAGYEMGVATNDATIAARTALASLGLDRHLPHIFGYDSVPNPKPAGDIVHAFARAAGVVPEEVAVVGDNRHDIDMARNAGAGLAIGVLTGNSRRADLDPYADVVLDSIAELPDWLDKTYRDWRAPPVSSGQ